VTGTAGDTSVSFASAPTFIDRYSVIKIDDGVNSEIHHLVNRNGNSFSFSGLYDGTSLSHDYSSASVYLYYPVDFGMTQKEILLPSITIWGFTSEKETIEGEFNTIFDTVSVDNQTYKGRKAGQYLNWEVLIDCEERESYEILGILSNIVRRFLGKRIVWINGRKVNIDFSSPSTEMEATENYDIVPKIQYPASIQIREEMYERETVYKVETDNVSVSILEEE